MDRARVEVRVASQAQEAVQVLLVSKDTVEALRTDGHPTRPEFTGAALTTLLERSRFEGKRGQSFSLTGADGSVSWLVGCGAGWSTLGLRRAAATALRLVPAELPWSLELGLKSGLEPRHVEAALEGIMLGSYQFHRHVAPKPVPGPCTMVVPDTLDGEALRRHTEAVVEGAMLTRDLVNSPAGDLGPRELSQAALQVARDHGWESEVLTGDELLESGFRLVHAVGRASARPPCVTIIRGGPQGVPPALALIGKGVVFDSGGLNLKPASGMLLMRKDMGGAGTVLGILEAWGRLGRDLPFLAVIPAAENAVGPDSYRPGDVIQAHDGTTVEIGNTDAEGRLLLADAMSYARQQSPSRMLDLATLTGAARVALGPDVPALFGTDEELVASLLETSLVRDEPLWRMPLVKQYNDNLKTPFADINHMSSDPRGGCITAALFLQRFAGDTPWTHIDLYGWEDKGKPETPKGANGMLVRTVVEVMEQLADG